MIRSLVKAFVVSMLVCCAVVRTGAAAEKGRILDQSGRVITVLGPISPDALGATLMHEHLFQGLPEGVDLRPADKEAAKRWDQPFDAQHRVLFYSPFSVGGADAWRVGSVEDAIGEVMLYRDLGGKSVVDVSPINFLRAPRKLQEVARRTGVNIIAGTAFYYGDFLPKDMDRLSIDDLVSRLVSEITDGIEGTDMKAGIIGEVGANDFKVSPVESNEVRSLRASARASRLTGAAISLHGDPDRPQTWHLMLDILEQEGADLSRVIIGHVGGAIEMADTSFLESLLARGVYLQFDELGWPPMPQEPRYDERPMLEAIVTLIRNGHSKQILVSHDSFSKAHKAKYGGWGLMYVHAALVPYLQSKGILPESINDILVENPKRVLTFVKPQKLMRRGS